MVLSPLIQNAKIRIQNLQKQLAEIQAKLKENLKLQESKKGENKPELNINPQSNSKNLTQQKQQNQSFSRGR